jgi:NAD(P)-dependent dehydrogenase (short-subunit alcohol dehydrogenase family)
MLTAMGRTADVDDLTGIYHFLAADESRYMTGQTLIVDGGWRDMLTPQLLAKLTGASQAPG